VSAPITAAMRTIFGNVSHSVEQYANNRAEVSHQPNGFSRSMMRSGACSKWADTC
jgi:hypothetical protein